MTVPLYGLVLAGGRSTRMGQDKATLAYHGASQLEWAMSLIEPFVERAFVSVRADQTNDAVRARFPQIVDARENLGPIAGILAAQARCPEAAWLILGCDLPFLDAKTLQHLLANRQSEKQVTAFRSSHDGLPEPLCALYEPASREPLAAYVTGGRQCPRKFLIQLQSAAHLLDEPNTHALDNVNTRKEHGAALDSLNSDSTRVIKHLTAQYFALLRDQAGRREESIDTQARNPGELYEELKARHGFTLARDALRVAVNSEFGTWTQPLNEGDVIVFIPPVAGG